MNGKLLAYHKIKTLPLPSSRRETRAIRRVFDNSQIIERFEKWLLICGKSQSTRINYRDAARQFARFLLDKPITAATKDDVRDFIGSLHAKGLASTTIQARLDALRVLGDCLQLGGLVRASVPRFILRRKVPKRLPHAISEEEIKRLIAAAQTPRDRAILELGYASGLRVSELANLRIEDLNFKARSLTVRQGKGGKDRIGLFGRPAAGALREYIGDRTTGWLFLRQEGRRGGGVWRGPYGIWFGQWRETDTNGKRVVRTVRLGDYEIPTKERAREALAAFLEGKLPVIHDKSKGRLSKRGIHRIVVKAAKRAGLTGVHPHILRHSCATHCLNHGMDIRHVQEMLGHTSLVATQKYLHLATANLQAVHAKFFPRG
jgi:site-specific recombinase XerD